MDAGIGVNQDALGGESMGTVAGDGVTVIKVAVPGPVSAHEEQPPAAARAEICR